MWKVEITDTAAKEIMTLPTDLRAELFRAFELLEVHGPQDLPPKFAKKISGKLWELRVKSESGIARSMYFTVNPMRAIVISAFVKKSQKLPAREIENAETRMKSWIFQQDKKSKGQTK